jgi:hypothetical protein
MTGERFSSFQADKERITSKSLHQPYNFIFYFLAAWRNQRLVAFRNETKTKIDIRQISSNFILLLINFSVTLA